VYVARSDGCVSSCIVVGYVGLTEYK